MQTELNKIAFWVGRKEVYVNFKRFTVVVLDFSERVL